jgi:hypothetical protein
VDWLTLLGAKMIVGKADGRRYRVKLSRHVFEGSEEQISVVGRVEPEQGERGIQGGNSELGRPPRVRWEDGANEVRRITSGSSQIFPKRLDRKTLLVYRE